MSEVVGIAIVETKLNLTKLRERVDAHLALLFHISSACYCLILPFYLNDDDDDDYDGS